MLVSQPPRLDSPTHAQQESCSGDEEQTGSRVFAVDQTTNNMGRKGKIFCILFCATLHRSSSRGGVNFHSPIPCFNMKILQNNFLWILNTKKPKSNSVANKDLITKHSIKNHFTADHQDPDRRKCCVLLLVGATQLFQHCRPLCSGQWGSRNPGIFLWYFLKWWCWSLNRWSCWSFTTVLIDFIFQETMLIFFTIFHFFAMSSVCSNPIM